MNRGNKRHLWSGPAIFVLIAGVDALRGVLDGLLRDERPLTAIQMITTAVETKIHRASPSTLH